jgi:hypothetical protein
VEAKDGRGTSPRVRLPIRVEKSLPQQRVSLLADRHLAASWPQYTCEIASEFHRMIPPVGGANGDGAQLGGGTGATGGGDGANMSRCRRMSKR